MTLMGIKNNKKTFDGIDYERFKGVFLPLNIKSEKLDLNSDVKKAVMRNVEILIDELIEEFENKK